MGKTFKDSLSKKDRGFRFSRTDKKKPALSGKDKEMRYKRRFKIYEEPDTYEE